jgi:hypothetical protein
MKTPYPTVTIQTEVELYLPPIPDHFMPTTGLESDRLVMADLTEDQVETIVAEWSEAFHRQWRAARNARATQKQEQHP